MEAEDVADLHIRVKDQLINDVQSQIKQWRQENFTKPMVGPIKQTKELEDGFKKVNTHDASDWQCELDKRTSHEQWSYLNLWEKIFISNWFFFN